MKQIYIIPLTKKQQNIADFIQSYYDEHKYNPTLKTIAEHFGISIPATHQQVQAIKSKNWETKVNYCPTCGRKIDET